MKKIRILLVILIVTAIVVSIIMIIAQSKNKKEVTGKNEVNNIVEISKMETIDTFDKSQLKNIELVNNKNKYFAVKEIINKYTNNSFIITAMYISKIQTNIDIFWLDGFNKNSNMVENYIVATDSSNKTFRVVDGAVIQQNGYTRDSISKFNITEIEKTENNNFNYKNINDEEYAKALLADYIEKALYSSELGYNLLDEEYRNLKFGSIEEYTKYINSKRDELVLYDAKNVKQAGEFSSYEEWMLYFQSIKLLEINKYEIENYNNKTSYIIVDTYDNYYVFQPTSTMMYTVILDTYTVDTEKYLNEYKNADDQEKVEININKIIDAINDNDYNYIYKKLDENFSKNNFSSLDDFETKMKNYFFEKNDVEFDDYNEIETGEHEYSLTITDSTKADTRKLEVKAILVLKQDTDFTIKFQ